MCRVCNPTASRLHAVLILVGTKKLVAPERLELSCPKTVVPKTTAYAFRHGAVVSGDGFEPSWTFVFRSTGERFQPDSATHSK